MTGAWFPFVPPRVRRRVQNNTHTHWCNYTQISLLEYVGKNIYIYILVYLQYSINFKCNERTHLHFPDGAAVEVPKNKSSDESK